MMRMEAVRDDQALLELLADSAEWLAQGRAQGLEQGIERGIEQGREQGLERGLAEGERRGQRVLLQSLAARRFGDHTAERLNVFLDEAPHSERAMQAGNWLMDCQTEAEFLQRLEAAA
ncbi:MAG: transposase [Gammaproteobacteria bacterium]|nr:transposase [Gammaproteobacteria bacterium]